MPRDEFDKPHGTLRRASYGQGPSSLIASLKSSPSERKGGVVPSIAFRKTSRSDCCAAVSVFAIVVVGGNTAPWGPKPCSGKTYHDDRLYVEHYHAYTGQFIIGAVFKKGTRRDPDFFVGLLSGPP